MKADAVIREENGYRDSRAAKNPNFVNEEELLFLFGRWFTADASQNC